MVVNALQVFAGMYKSEEVAFPKVLLLEPGSGDHGVLIPLLALVTTGANLHPFNVKAGLTCFAKQGLCAIKGSFTSKKVNTRDGDEN